MNLRDRDNLRTKDKRPVPKVSFVRRLDCIMYYIYGISRPSLLIESTNSMIMIDDYNIIINNSIMALKEPCKE